MRTRRPLLLSVALVGALGLTTAVALADTSWGRAIKVPGLATLSHSGAAHLLSISCATARSCAAGGDFFDRAGHGQAFVVDKKNGVWRTAIEVPHSGALNRGGFAAVESISCATATSCAAGGTFFDRSGHRQAFVVNETNGAWRKAIEVPGVATLNRGGNATVYSISCATARSCAAGGAYRDRAGHTQAFVVNETNGVWRRAVAVPGLGHLNVGGDAEVVSISCGSAHSCAAGGFYSVGFGAGQGHAFVANEKNGVWHKAITVQSPAGAPLGGSATVESVSCATAGSCAAGGFYSDASGHDQAFVVDATNGTWGTAIEVPGSDALNLGDAASVLSVSCAAAGSCAASGDYSVAHGYTQAFVVDETNGVWGTAIEVPGTAALNAGEIGWAVTISCAKAGYCAAGGDYNDASLHTHAFVAEETSGVWDTAIEVPRSARLAQGGPAEVTAISCGSAGSCAAGGSYGGSSAFVTTP